MPGLLLDENLSYRIARQLVAGQPSVPAASVHDWQDGNFLHSPDFLILEAARVEGLVLVTYDQRTVMRMLREWGEAEIDHAGVIFVDELTIKPNDFGTLVTALRKLWEAESSLDWTNRVTFLRPPASYR